jgi:hypothetical protein
MTSETALVGSIESEGLCFKRFRKGPIVRVCQCNLQREARVPSLGMFTAVGCGNSLGYLLRGKINS